MTVGYRPERNVSAKLTSEAIQRYQELIGVLCLAAEHGHVDILVETAMLSTYMALPRKGHMEQVYHVFGYLKTHSKRWLFLTQGILTLTNVPSVAMNGTIFIVTQSSKCRTTCRLQGGMLCLPTVSLMQITHQIR